jgi:hypothetical protein
MINRLEFLIMFFGFAILGKVYSNSLMLIASIGCGFIWVYYWIEDWNHQDDYDEDN